MPSGAPSATCLFHLSQITYITVEPRGGVKSVSLSKANLRVYFPGGSLRLEGYLVNCLYIIASWASSISVIDPRVEIHFELRVVQPLTVHPAWWKHWGDKGSEERNWPPCLTKPMAQENCLSPK